MKKIYVKPTFVKTKNVRQFEYLMDGLALGVGEGRLGLVFGRAGRGKTRTSQWYSANKDCIYLRIATIWNTSETEFLRALYREVLKTDTSPYRKGPCFIEIVDRLLTNPCPVFLDELEKLPRHFLDLVRDLSDMSAAPFILIGEEELVPYMRRNRRVWSRTFRQLEFEPISEGDIIFYVSEATGLKVSAEVGKILHKNSAGDFRIVRRDTVMLVHLLNSKGVPEPDVELTSLAVKQGFNGS